MAKNRIKLLAALVAAGMSLAACGSADEGASSNQSSSDSTISIEDNNGELQVPKNPKSVVALDNRSFEILNEWGVELSLIHISEPTRLRQLSRMPSSA